MLTFNMKDVSYIIIYQHRLINCKYVDLYCFCNSITISTTLNCYVTVIICCVLKLPLNTMLAKNKIFYSYMNGIFDLRYSCHGL